MQEPVLDALDRAVVNALQIHPRGSWTQIANVLGSDPVTVARRWERLHSAGLVWVTAYPAGVQLMPAALVEIESDGRSLAHVEQLMSDAEYLTIEVVSGSRDLLVHVNATDESALTDYILLRIAALPSLRGVRTHLISTIYKEAAQWRLNVLDEQQDARLAAMAPQRRWPVERGPLTPVEKAVAEALRADGRMKSADIAERAGIPVRRARDVVTNLLTTGWVVLRADMGRVVAGHPVGCWYFLRVPAPGLERTAAQVAAMPETRAVLGTTGPHNLMVSVWQPQLTDVPRMEAAFEAIPGVRVMDRCVSLRAIKRAGVNLDPSGFRTVRART
ncbi:Lrp/AsnC family transcriptional regulator [Actinomycetes bacterium KLBMP 9759]